MSGPAAAGLARLLERLRDARCYPHPAGAVQVLETHISAVVLTGAFAYKIKKPVALGFLDFTSLQARRFYCEEELRLNRRTAPQLYIDVVAITGTVDAPVIEGTGPAIEYALRMREFPQAALLDSMARRKALLPEHVESLAHGVAAFHAGAAKSGPGRRASSTERILSLALENVDQMEALAIGCAESASLESLRRWTHAEYDKLGSLFQTRFREGMVRECHGDLHLRNIALLEGVPTPFDCIEFNEDFRWIDVMSESAFVFMDLAAHGLPLLAFQFIDTYLHDSGDYAGLRLLRFYAVYRALVRAKVAGIRASQSEASVQEKARSVEHFRSHLKLALDLSTLMRPALVIMHGLSGSGKSTVAAQLLAALGAIRCRSDVERKRMHGVPEDARTDSAPDAGVYSPDANRLTYDRLAAVCRHGIESGYPVIVDAAFLRKAQRDRFRALALEFGAPFVIASCTAPTALLRERVARRAAQGTDASEAGVAVLERQLHSVEALAPEEAAVVLSIDTSGVEALSRNGARALAERLNLAPL